MFYLFLAIVVLASYASTAVATGSETIHTSQPDKKLCYASVFKNATSEMIQSHGVRSKDIKKLGDIFQRALNTPQTYNLSFSQQLETSKQGKKRSFMLHSTFKIDGQATPQTKTVSKELSRKKALKLMMALELHNSGHTTSFELFPKGSELITRAYEKQRKQIKKLRTHQKEQDQKIEVQEKRLALWGELTKTLQTKITNLERAALESPFLEIGI